MQSGYGIRELQVEDLQRALALVREVFMEFEAPDYSDEGVREFLDFIEYEAIKAKIEEGQIRFWGCFEGEVIVGVLAVRLPCHICLLFVDKRHHRRGIARAMLSNMIAFYSANSDCTEITVFSSPYAVEAYRRLGFEDIDAEQTIKGICFTPMKRPL